MENNKSRLEFKDDKMTQLYEVLQKFIPEDTIGGDYCGDYEAILIPVKVSTEFGECVTEDWEISIDKDGCGIMIPYKLAEKVIKCTPDYYNDEISFDDEVPNEREEK